MRKHLIIVGRGHAHMMILESLDQFVQRGWKVTVIAPSAHHYYSGMGPGMLGGSYAPEDIRFATQKVVLDHGGIFVKDRVVSVEPEKREVFTASGHGFKYDLVCFNAGSQVETTDILSGDPFYTVYPVKPIEKLMDARGKLETLLTRGGVCVNIVGGGPSAAEVAGNIWQLSRHVDCPSPPLIRILAGKRFMVRCPEAVRSRVRRILENRGIEIVEDAYVAQVGEKKIHLASGTDIPSDFTFLALGVTPSPIFEASGLPVGPDGGLLVNDFLQSVKYPEIFGGGDCIYFEPQPLDKVGVYAVRQNPVLLHNLLARMDDKPLRVFEPGGDYLLIFNLGGGKGVFKKKEWCFSGRLAFWIKNAIDTRFMNRFQSIEKNGKAFQSGGMIRTRK